MKTTINQFDSKGRKFLFYFMGKPVYEGDETHQHMEYVRKNFNGDYAKAALYEKKNIDKLLKPKK